MRRVLSTIMSERLLTKKQLAEAVGVQEETLEDILDLLARRGLLSVSSNCSSSPSCASCPLASSCDSHQRREVTYTLTQKGIRYVRQEAR
ncbi:MAG: hypothetical protein DRO73_06685 [Candidatus Thorarchaeota archaeon]|nr:MAG: hypothetical protein DRO73_06685 [Candidatus Thorarchaeota archaeon]RLI55388.1 MAG: hypothetical protein DRO93_11985 [Candidatus Thorarchaeota archaeon]